MTDPEAFTAMLDRAADLVSAAARVFPKAGKRTLESICAEAVKMNLKQSSEKRDTKEPAK